MTNQKALLFVPAGFWQNLQDSEVLIAINSQGLYVIDPINVVSLKAFDVKC